MPAEDQTDPQIEIGHVLSMDVVGYSKLLIREQTELLRRLSEIVRGTAHFRAADAQGNLIRLPTGDGITLVFFGDPKAPIECATEIAAALKNEPGIPLRIGIHSGPINRVPDVNERANVAGAGIDLAQRVMDSGDAGHILLSKRVADDLAAYSRWNPHLHELGDCEVKHGRKITLINFYTDTIGNSQRPRKLQVRHRARAKSVIAAVCIAIVLAAGFFFLARWRQVVSTSATPADSKSIAVLPFENLSDDKQNAFFADGIQDDLLTSLSKISGLKVISRTSVLQYRGNATMRNLREIGLALDVANVLEGSVRRDGNRVVLNVQLIDALNDRHLWAERFDRTLEDSLGLQGELATDIAAKLRAKLSPEEKARVESKPTENADAYVLYLKARGFETTPNRSLQDYKMAEKLYLEAIGHDPAFALAHARLSATLARIYHWFEPTEARKDRTKAAAEEALRLKPDLGEARLALGLYYYWIEGGYERALREFDLASAALPNNSDIGYFVAAMRRRQGRWDENLEQLRKIQTLDPANVNIVEEIVYTNCFRRDWEAAARNQDRVLTLAPDSVNAKVYGGYIDFWSKGDTAMLARILAGIAPEVDPDGLVTLAHWDRNMIERDFTAAAKTLAATQREDFPVNGQPIPKSFFAGCTALAQGNTVQAQASFEEARPQFEGAVQEAPGSALRHANLGLLYALMGRKEPAMREGRRSVELAPESKDAVIGPWMAGYLAMIYTRVGEIDLALPLLEHLLSVPGQVDRPNCSITLSDLRRRWQWDPLRKDPRFQKLLSQTQTTPGS
jgi:TolB-like protein/Tfp pilus assembly protein PilF